MNLLHQNVALLEVAEPALLDELLADPKSAALIMVRLSDRMAAVAPENFDLLVAQLRKLGHLPKVLEA